MKVVPAHYALFSGCAVNGGGSPARGAAIALARTLGIELWEAPALGCCGARVDRPADETTLRHLRDPLAEATNQGLAIACLSPGCRQVIASRLLPADQGNPAADPAGRPAPRVVDSVQLLTWAGDPDRLTNALVRSLSPLRVALHGACHGDHIPAPKPGPKKQNLLGDHVAGGAAEHTAGIPPAHALAGLIAAAGAKPLEEVSLAGRCAKAPLLPRPVGTRADAPACLTLAAQAGVDVVVTPCFLCFGELNERQRRLSRDDPARSVPVLHLTQLLGLACGAAPQRLELRHLTVSARRLLVPFVS